MKSISLYELSDQYRFLMNDLYDEETGVVNETALEKINQLQDSIQNKCVNITKLFKSIEITQKLIAEEKERLAKREKSFKDQVNRLKDYLKTNMEKCDINKIECPEFTISLQNNPQSVDIIDEDKIPHEYDKKKDRELDLRLILSDLKNGVVIQGAQLKQSKSVRIR